MLINLQTGGRGNCRYKVIMGFPTVTTTEAFLLSLILVLPAFLVYHVIFSPSEPTVAAPATEETEKQDQKGEKEKPKTIMQPARTDLDPPKDDPFTLEQLKEFDGSTAGKPIYVAIKGSWPSSLPQRTT